MCAFVEAPDVDNKAKEINLIASVYFEVVVFNLTLEKIMNFWDVFRKSWNTLFSWCDSVNNFFTITLPGIFS